MISASKATYRTIGKPLHFGRGTLSRILAQKQTILDEINANGCVCLKGLDLQPKQMVDFTRAMWGNVIELPGFLAFNNQDPSYRQVARVGNIKFDGTIKDSRKEATHWHQDGDFWGEGKNHIFNCLHTREIPRVGGQTHVMDLVSAANYLRQHRPAVFERLKDLVGLLNVEQIQDFRAHGAKNILGLETQTRHTLIRKMQGSCDQSEVLFLSVLQLIDRRTMQKCQDLRIEQIHSLLQKEMGFYSHRWEEGDMLIWDNLQVMHRSAGNFEGRRLLYRTQGQLL